MYLFDHYQWVKGDSLRITFLIMGRIDPVECVGVSQQRNGNVLNVKPPAMRVRDDCYTKITFPL